MVVLQNDQETTRFVHLAFGWTLITLAAFDVLEHRLPNAITLPGTALGLVLSFIPGSIGFLSAVSGALFGAGVLYLAGVIGSWLFKRQSMGGGDIKLAAMIGSFLGWQKTMVVLFLSPIVGAVVGVAVVLVQQKSLKNQAIPFGPFLAAAALIAVLFGDSIIQWYFDWMTGI